MVKNTLIKSLLILPLLFGASEAKSQYIKPGDKIPSGAIIYSLPITAIHIVAEASYDTFTAGPFAKYAQKYLGVPAKEENSVTYTLKSVELIPYIEADPEANIALNLGNSKNASANFLEMINQGLIMWSDSYAGKNEKMRYPDMRSNTLFVKSMSTSNLTSEKSTLYRTAKTPTGTERASVQQSQVVEKSLEKKAEETASMIFKLRAKRLEIITGETDATFSGEALTAAIAEINRLEEEYLSLFFGKEGSASQTMTFDIVPKNDGDKQIYIAFRFSENQGLLPVNNVSGRPVVMELTGDDNLSQLNADTTPGKGKVFYRKPVVMNVRLMDGQNMLIQSRIPVYQLGTLLSFPIDIAMGKM